MCTMTKQANFINMVDFVILQFCFACQSVFKNFTSILTWDFWEKQNTPIEESSDHTNDNEKRHFIQLYKTEPKELGEKPVCYMHVIEFDNSSQEEEIRQRKRSYEVFQKHVNNKRHYRTRSDQDIHKFYCSNFRY